MEEKNQFFEMLNELKLVRDGCCAGELRPCGYCKEMLDTLTTERHLRNRADILRIKFDLLAGTRPKTK